jgi:hypothetical protein
LQRFAVIETIPPDVILCFDGSFRCKYWLLNHRRDVVGGPGFPPTAARFDIC